MQTVQTLKPVGTNADRNRPHGPQSRRSSACHTMPGLQDLADCHSSEHLLVGTHRLDGANGASPVCLTCRIQGR